VNEGAMVHWGAVAQEINKQAIFKALDIVLFGFILVVFGNLIW
jgi:hypothetical protein